MAAEVAVAASAAGGRVELVGSVGDDAEGDEVIIRLARAGVGHAAVLRDPAGHTPVADGGSGGPFSRLDAEDIGLGLGYLFGCQVLVIAEPLADDVVAVALEAARYHAASVVAVVPEGEDANVTLLEGATVLQAPREGSAAFARMVGRYAATLATGVSAAEAFATATQEAGWEAAPE